MPFDHRCINLSKFEDNLVQSVLAGFRMSTLSLIELATSSLSEAHTAN